MTPRTFRRALRVALLSVSKDPFRYVLNGVSFGDDYVEATNGHHMLRVTLPAGFVTRKGSATAAAVKRLVGWLGYEPEPDSDRYVFPTAEMLPFADVTYPDTEKLWAVGEGRTPAPRIGFSAEYLGILGKASKLLGDVPSGSAVMVIGAADEAALFSLASEELPTKFLLMPQQIGEWTAARAARAAGAREVLKPPPPEIDRVVAGQA